MQQLVAISFALPRNRGIALLSIAAVGATEAVSLDQLHARACKRWACQFYIMAMSVMVVIIIIMQLLGIPIIS